MTIIRLLKLTLILLPLAATVGLLILGAVLAATRPGWSWRRYLHTGARAIAALIVLEACGFLYIRLIEPNWIVTRHLHITDSPLAQRLAGRRLVQLSDLHIDRFGPRERTMVRLANRQDADWIVITGDFINSTQGWPAALQAVAQLKARQGVFAVPGNTDNSFLTPKQFAEGLSAIGVTVLRNQAMALAGSDVQLIGLDDPVEGQERLSYATESMSADDLAASILLAHGPSVFPAAAEKGIPLVLVGHTHGGQLGIGWLRRLSRYAERGPYVSGPYRQGASLMWVNRGIGTKVLPYRFLAAPEVTVIDFGKRGRRAAEPAAAKPEPSAELEDEAPQPTPNFPTVDPAVVSFDRLSGLLFARRIEQWQRIDPISVKPVVRVPLALVGPDVPLSVDFPISGSVPFPMGQLHSGDAVRLSDNGGAIWTMQSRPLLWWEDGSIKWLQIASRVPPTAAGRDLSLEYGAGVRPESLSGPSVRIVDAPQSVTIDTGPLRLVLSRARLGAIDSASVDVNGDGAFEDAERMATAGDWVVMQDDQTLHAAQAQRPRLTIEESGPLRATVTASGWWRTRAGACRLSVRVHAFAGLPQVAITPTWSCAQPIAGPVQMGLEMPIVLGREIELLSADGHGPFQSTLDAPLSVQPLPDGAYQLRRAAASIRDGSQHEGWILVQDRSSGVLAGALDAAGEGAPLLSIDPATKRLRLMWQDPSDGGRLITHDAFLGFLGARVEPEIARGLASLWRSPWLLTATPTWLQETDALGPLGPVKAERFPDAEALLERWLGRADVQSADEPRDATELAERHAGAMTAFLRTLRADEFLAARRLGRRLLGRAQVDQLRQAGLFAHFAATGDARYREALARIDRALRAEREGPRSLDQLGHRLLAQTLLYETTWDPALGQQIRRTAQAIASAQRQDGAWSHRYDPSSDRWSQDADAQSVASVLPSLIAAHRLIADPRLEAAITTAVDGLLGNGGAVGLDAIAYSYLLSGRQHFVEAGMQRLASFAAQARANVAAGTQTPAAPDPSSAGAWLWQVPIFVGALDAPDVPTLRQLLGVGESPSAPSTDATPSSPIHVLVMPSLEKVIPEDGTLSGAHPSPVRMSLARNEYESTQLVVRPASALSKVRLELHDLSRAGGQGVIPSSAIAWSAVGFVKTDKPDYPVTHIGLWPDPLHDASPVDVAAGFPQPFWVTVYAAPGTTPGQYEGTITVHADGAPASDVQMLVTVWDFELPATPSLKSAFDIYPQRLGDTYDRWFPSWAQALKAEGIGPEQLAHQIERDLVRRRLAPMRHVPVDGTANPSSIDWTGVSAFALGQYGGSFDNHWPQSPEAMDRLASQYHAAADELARIGVLDRHYIYAYDEPKPGLPAVANVTRMLHHADPRLRLLVTMNQPADVERLRAWFEPIDIVCWRNVVFDPAQAQALQRMGKENWLYVSGPRPPYPTLVIDYPSIAYRVLPWMCWKYGIKGLLYWCVDYWTTNPYEQPMNREPGHNGNGSLYYPGPRGPVPSIRLEVLRDGMEDYEYLALLAEAVRKAESSGQANAELIAEAKQVLAVDSRVVESMRIYTNDPQRLLTARARIAELIQTLQVR